MVFVESFVPMLVRLSEIVLGVGLFYQHWWERLQSQRAQSVRIAVISCCFDIPKILHR